MHEQQDNNSTATMTTMASDAPSSAAQQQQAASAKPSRHQAAAATQAANELLRLLGDTAKHLACIQQHMDGGTFLVFQGGVELAHILQVGSSSNNNKPSIAPGHERDAVCIEDLCACIRTYAAQVVKRDLTGAASGEEQSMKLRKAIMDPLLETHRVLATASASVLALYHAMHRISSPGKIPWCSNAS